MTDYRIEMDNYNGTYVEINSNDKVIANRIELAIDHIFKEFEKDKEND